MTDRKLELAFIDKDGKVYPLDEVTSVSWLTVLKRFPKKLQKRLSLQKQQR